MAKLLEARDVRVEEIDATDRLRPVSDSAVAAIMTSIEQVGDTLTPITVRAMSDGRLRLIAGGHRLEAFRRLERPTIRAEVWQCSDDWAKLAEIDENLAGADLSVLELSTFLASRKAVYERLNPTTAKGRAGAAARWVEDASDMMSFASATAEKRGISTRHVERLVRVGQNLDAAAVETLRGIEGQLKLADLKQLAELTPDQQRAAANDATDANSGSLKAAIQKAKGKKAAKAPSAEETALRKMRELWARAPMKAKRAFLDDLAGDPKTAKMISAALGKAQG
ncbi:MAG: ParB N-terminal domain-containing protein [Pseudomonadota bacterium]